MATVIDCSVGPSEHLEACPDRREAIMPGDQGKECPRCQAIFARKVVRWCEEHGAHASIYTCAEPGCGGTRGYGGWSDPEDMRGFRPRVMGGRG